MPPAISAEAIEQLRQTSTATLTSQLLKRGFARTFMTGVRPLRPHDRMVGAAFTLRYVPAREDLDRGVEFDNETNVQRLAVERVGPGEVLVIDARGDVSAATLGNILAARLRMRGAAGIVTDGAFRDAARIAEEPLPTYCRAAHAAISSTAHHPTDLQVTIGCGGVMVVPGDIVVGDDEGVVVVPRHLAEEVAAAAYEQERLEEFILAKVRAGASIRGVYPPSDDIRAEYDRTRNKAADRPPD